MRVFNTPLREKSQPQRLLQILKTLLYIIIFTIAYKTGRTTKQEYVTAYSDRPLNFAADGTELAVLDQAEACPTPLPGDEIEMPCPVAQLPQGAYPHDYGVEGDKPCRKGFCPCPSRPFEMAKLHKNIGTYTMDKIFSHLHHASSMANVELIMTTQSREDWLAPIAEEAEDGGRIHRACSEVYVTRTGGRSSQPNKCVAIARVAGRGAVSITQLGHRKGETARMVDQYQNDYSRDYSRAEETVLLAPLLERLDDLKKEFRDKLGPQIGPDGRRRAAVVMVANEGVMDLLLNFLCSTKHSGIDMSSFIVFVGREEYITVVEEMGIKAMHSAWLGAMPKHAAKSYLDNTFSRMMWYKMVCVYIAIAAGYDVLFQDVDLIWLKDPISVLRDMPADMMFMDDGARTPRYTPFYVNSGFFYLKFNPKTLFFQEKMMKCAASEIGYTHSHQAFMIRQLSEAVHLAGIDVLVLDLDDFPSGIQYHHNKGFMKKIREKSIVPYLFHMCWTDNRVDKVRYFKIMDMWYLPETKQCTDSASMLEMANLMREKNPSRSDQDKVSFTSACCTATGWHSIGTPMPDNMSNKQLYDDCLTAKYTSAEWYQNCDNLFVHDNGGKKRVANIERSLRYGTK